MANHTPCQDYVKFLPKYQIFFVTVDKQLEVDAVPGTKCKREGIRARSRSMVNGVRKLTRLHSFSGSVPRYSGILLGVRE